VTPSYVPFPVLCGTLAKLLLVFHERLKPFGAASVQYADFNFSYAATLVALYCSECIQGSSWNLNPNEGLIDS